MNDIERIIGELNKVYRLYYSLYNDFSKIPNNKNQGINNLFNPMSNQGKNNPYVSFPNQNPLNIYPKYSDRIKAFLFKEI